MSQRSKRRNSSSQSKKPKKTTLWEVEKILDSEVVGSKTMYKIRWKGYSDDNDTWEPDSNLIGLSDSLIQDYWKLQKK